ncbi:hypothetical protein K504DRAFT_493235 [Pleomassaria siparia CBS 279.74]|uniref:Secreted protein n=1 Tax=Pleomassaria siparia CBS 279.74 TaxID=1314801 RepID=A0A6G1K281_9PLEO|nr:hypothetical protein K504DRAFT_493235 [Pleomassaria siparia CBS 279.74]
MAFVCVCVCVCACVLPCLPFVVQGRTYWEDLEGPQWRSVRIRGRGSLLSGTEGSLQPMTRVLGASCQMFSTVPSLGHVLDRSNFRVWWRERGRGSGGVVWHTHTPGRHAWHEEDFMDT